MLLTELPAVLLLEVFSNISDPLDIAALVSTCHLFGELVPIVRWHLRLISERSGNSANWQRAAMSMIRTRLPFTRKLDLSWSSIMAEDVTSILGYLKNLDILILDNNQKLTSPVIDALAVCVRSGPRTISLQRCFAVGSTAAGNLLAAAGVDGSRLQCILLSHLDRVDLPRDSPTIEDSIENLQIVPKVGSGLKMLALHSCGGLGSFELAALAKTCPLLEFLFLGGSSRVEERVLETASSIVDLTNNLKNIKVVELTFFASEVLQTAREMLTKDVKLWDFCERESLYEAVSLATGQDSISLAIRAASNCSDIRKRTPLHVAAASGDTDCTTFLVELGASTTGMKDTGGATALFIAAEMGHTSICEILLHRGADVFAQNRSGENPLYIAALVGQSETVKIMLSYCVSHGWNWQNSKLYSDGWTPLMAAAVADRQDAAKAILMCNESSSNSLELLDSQNRHGQTALHIASRRASVWFVTNLLAAGASTDIGDEYGRRPVDVAAEHEHRSIVEILGGGARVVRNNRRYHRPRKIKP